MYKYTEKFVADLLFNENSIRIGTLNGFRDMEAKQGISDPLEGSYQDKLKIDYFDERDFYTNPNLRQNVQNSFSIGPGCHNVRFINPTIITTRYSPNYLIFCTAHSKSEKLLNEFEGADTCYNIHKPFSFYQLITWELEKELQCKVNFLGIYEVIYDEYERIRSGMNSRHIPPALAKTKEFSPQCELRAIWEVPQNLITKHHYDLNVLGLRKYCQIIDL